MANIYSPNMIKTFQTCSKKYYYQYLEKVNMPKSVLPFEKGKKIHAIANYYLQKIDVSRIENALNEKEKQSWQLLRSNEYYNKTCFKSEFPLYAKIGNYWIGGRIDAIVKEGEKYYILDYKTGSAPQNPEYDVQTMIYLLCADCYLKSYETLSFVYINLKNKTNYIIEFSEDLKKKYCELLIKSCAAIEKETMYHPVENDCKFCEYSKLCKG